MLHIEPPRANNALLTPPLMAGETAHIRLSSTLDQIQQPCNYVLACLPDNCSQFYRDQIKTVMTECLSNAIVHGNLEIDSSRRAAGDWAGYKAQLQARQADPHYSQREVLLDFAIRAQGLYLAVEDQGAGFTPPAVDASASIEDLALAESGRGLMIVRQIAQQVTFNALGNRIEVLLPLY